LHAGTVVWFRIMVEKKPGSVMIAKAVVFEFLIISASADEKYVYQ